MFEIAPSIFAANFSALGAEIKALELAGAKILHIDIMDGHFVPNLSFGPAVVTNLRRETDMIFDVHLMVEEPEKFITAFAKAGADIITFHLESGGDVERCLSAIKGLGKKAGIAIKPATAAEQVLPYLEAIDTVLVMTVEPGFGGQKFMNLCPKIEFLKNECTKRGLKTNIEVDGGINLKTIPLVVKAGANILVIGTALFSQHDYQLAMEKFRSVAIN